MEWNNLAQYRDNVKETGNMVSSDFIKTPRMSSLKKDHVLYSYCGFPLHPHTEHRGGGQLINVDKRYINRQHMKSAVGFI